jgi:hypothetical protein
MKKLLELSQSILSFVENSHGDSLFLLNVLDNRGLALLSLLIDEISKQLVVIGIGSFKGL